MASSIRPGQVNGIHLSCRPSRDTTQSCKLPAETDSSTVTTTCGYHYIEDLSRNYFPHTTAAQIPVSLFPTLNIYREPYLSDRSNIHVDQQVRYVRRRPILLPSGEHTSAMERLQALRVQQEVFRYQYERETNVPLVSMTTTRSEGFVPPGHSLAGTSVTGFDHSVVSKRPRLAVEMKPTLHHPLVIDTSNASEVRKDLMYNPQVEAISPTPPEDTRFLVSPQRSSKDDVLQSINRINREIVQLDQQVTNLQKKQHQLEREASQPSDSSDISQETSVSELKQLSRAQLIYSDNKNKARKAQNFMEHLGPKIDLPLYNQPSDTAVYHENKRKFMTLKKKLIVILLKKQQERQLRETFLMENYTKLMQEWLKKIDKRNSNGNRRAKETKQREFFEKQFPELKKQREDKERFSRVGQRVKSEAEMEEILDGIHEQELEDKKMKSYTVIPPILLDLRRRRIKFINNNGFVEDLVAEYQQRHFLNMWTNQEKDVFREKYLQHLKNFVFIASHLERKDVADCVQYYYLTKKSENYKQLIRKQSARKRTRTLVKPSSYGHSATQSSITPTTALTTTAGRNVGVTTTTLTPLFSTASSSTLDSEAKHEEDVAGLVNVHDCQSSSLMAVVSRMDCSSKVQIEVGDNEVIQKTDNSLEEEYKDFQSETSRCAVCHIFLDNLSQSHHATKSNCNSFGLKGTDLHVCSSCNIKSTRRSCPIPTCKTSKQKLKRLRSFPSKWDEVSEQLRDSVVAEFQIPQGVQACCCGCFNRISRKLGIPSKSKDTELEKWSNEEIELFKCGLRQFGKNWESILKMVTSKTKEDCQYLYLHFKEKLNVEASNKGDKQLDEDRIIERKLQDFGTKDEDSGEITSSCEEDNCIDRCSSDTASALSPDIGEEAGMKSKEVPETIDQNMNLRKSTDSLKNSLDYDSSATMSADEDQGQNGSQLRRKELNSIIQNILVSDDTIEPKDHVPVTKALSPIPVPCSQYNVPVGKGPCKGEPTCVRDLIYQAIEYSLQAPNKSSHTSTPVPVTSHSKGSYNSVEVRQEEIEACLSRPPQVVHGSSVLPVSIPDAEGLAMMAQFSQILLREQNEVQDLSKKDKDLRIPTQRISSQLPSGSGVLHQQIPYSQYGAPPPAHSNQYSRSSQPPPDILPLSSLDVSRDTHFSCLGRAGFAQSDSLHLQPPHLVAQASSPGPQTRRLTVPPPPSPSINISPGQQTLGLTVPLPPLITNSKPSNSKFPHISSGSITQGTPLNLYPNPNIPLNPSNHEGLLRPIHPTQLKDVGSITHGTPLHDQKRPMKSNFCTVSACLPISGTEGGSNRRISPFSTEVLSKTAVPMTYEQVVDRECHRLTSSPYASSQSAYKISSNTIRAGFVSDTSSSKQLMIDFNTSKQMNRGSFTSDKESSKVQSSRDSSPHLLQQDSGLSQVCANVSFSAPEIHGTPLSTSMTDQSLSHSPENQWAFHRRQPDLQSFNAALSQPLSRQNIIRSITWGTGKPSVIQVPKSSSSCSPQSFSPATEKNHLHHTLPVIQCWPCLMMTSTHL
ncbi:nuclear receptor corepressor 1-like isoform X2 [Limulus polyphemus]|uniref:Nuclear receptor corepressor 1-like isoform X2 n=1 Tax=Limulus polyphemus TaxID=6850 RepID=A0ABM1T2J4_LIMPO|nr:nuclear receptor corepressor 1-like isoform X2 [Limulus polyphemus]